MQLEEYIEDHISAEPELLRQVYRDTYLHRLYPQMCSGHYQGRLLVMLTHMIRPMRILELGAFSGYSALCFAEGMPEGAEIHTVEIDDEAAESLRHTFAKSPRAADIHLHIGDALELIPKLSGPWDMVFIDANKRHYTDYYNMVLPHVSPGGYILADNTLWGDKVLHPEDSHDPQSRAIFDFNDMIAADPRVEKVILPIRDGMTIIRKIP